MAINIQNIINQVNTRLAAVDSNSSQSEILRLMKLANEIDNSSGVLEYQFASDLPIVDSSVVGKLAYIRSADEYLDSAGELAGRLTKFYFAKNDSDGWSELDMQIKSNLDSDYQLYLASSPPALPWRGSTYAYAINDNGYPVLMKHNIVSNTDSTFVGNMAGSPTAFQDAETAAATSGTYGYQMGGANQPAVGGTTSYFPYAVDENMTVYATSLNATAQFASGNYSSTYGYIAGGAGPSSFLANIQKFPFSEVWTTSTDVGDLAQGRRYAGSSSNAEYGYVQGGQQPVQSIPVMNNIDKYPFASDANGSDVGDLTIARFQTNGTQSDTYGYTAGGRTPTVQNTIDKYPFAADANATDVGDMSAAEMSVGLSAGLSNGYKLGGFPSGTAIESFSFVSDGNTTQPGALHQYNSNALSSATYGSLQV